MYKMNDKKIIKSILLFVITSLILSSCSHDKYSKTEENYGEEVLRYAKEYNLSPTYLKALIVLECSGNKPAGERFESDVYEKLKEVQEGTIKSYDLITQKQIRNCSDDALRNLATSWGPFQIMGYKCIRLGIEIQDLRGEECIKWGVKWINNEYGNLIRNNQFEKAFRIHNTGSPKGETYDPNYVSNGLDHIAYFDSQKSDFVTTDLPKKYIESAYFHKYDLKARLVIFVDFSKPRNQRRLWVIENNKVLASSYVAHGIGSGVVWATKFSNIKETNMSSLGIFSFNYFFKYKKRVKAPGFKFILDGLESTNNNAASRGIIIHLSPPNKQYVTEKGCTGNSKGCFVVSKEIFELIKEKSGFRTSYLIAVR